VLELKGLLTTAVRKISLSFFIRPIINYSDSETIITEDDLIKNDIFFTRLSSHHKQPSTKLIVMKDFYTQKIEKIEYNKCSSTLIIELNLTCGFQIKKFKKNNLYTLNLSKSVANKVHALKVKIDEIRKTIKKLYNKINSLIRVRNKTLIKELIEFGS